MTFDEALGLLKAGHIIRQSSWVAGDCLYIERGVLKMVSYGSTTRLRCFNVNSVLADDWEELQAVKV